MRRRGLHRLLFATAWALFVAYWLNASPISHLCLAAGIILHLCRLRLPVTSLNALDVAFGAIGSFVLSVPIMLVLSMFGIYDRSLGQDFVGYYAWAIFLVVVPGVIVLLVLWEVRKGVDYRSKQSASSDEFLEAEKPRDRTIHP